MESPFQNFIKTLSANDTLLIFDKFMFNDLVGVNITDAKGQTVFLNDAHTRITGHPKEMYLWHSMYELEKDTTVSESASIRVLSERREITLRQTTSDGKSFEVRGIPIFNKCGELIYVLNLLTDVTEIVESQKILKEMKEYADSLNLVMNSDNRLIFHSEIMRRLVSRAKRAAQTEAPVLITGPEGTDKNLIADIIHENSERSSKHFIRVNCAAIPDNLLESEFYGFEGNTSNRILGGSAASGSGTKIKKGFLEAASGGTLFLEDIDELPFKIQNRLVDTLRSGKLRRLGGARDIKINIRLVSSSTSDLRDKIRERKFREDLYYLINIVDISFPALKERKDDIPLLLSNYLRLYNAKYSLNASFETDAFNYLCSYEYPGNVRELKNIIERLVVQNASEIITLRDVYESLGVRNNTENDKSTFSAVPSLNADRSLKEIMEQQEKALLEEYIRVFKTGSELAKHLKTDQSTISRKLKKYGILY